MIPTNDPTIRCLDSDARSAGDGLGVRTAGQMVSPLA